MTPNSRQSKWDIYEAVILLDGYLEVLRGNQLRAHIVKRVSADLRQMAVNRGFEINESYRNENGISYQILSMDSAFKGEKVSVPATKIFDEAVILYRTDKRKYSEILEKAKNMIEATHNNKFEEMKNASEEADKYPELIKCDFTNYQEFAYTIPAYCSIAGVRFQEKTWSRVLVALTQNELDNHNPAMENLYQTSLMSGGRGQPYLMEERNDLRCKQLSNGYWVCTNYNIPDLIKMIVTLCLRCGYTKEQVVLYGAPKYTATGAKTYLDKAGEFNGAIVPKEKTSRENPLPLPVGQPESLESAKTVDFDANLDYSGTKPFFLSYFDEEIDFNHSWSGMYVVLAKCLYEDYPHIFKELSNDFTAGISPAIVASSAEKNRFIRPVAVCAEYVLETNKSATNIVHNIKIILDKCNVDYENIVIRLETTTSQKPSGSQNAGISFYEWLVKIRRLPEAKALIYDSSIDDFCEKHKVDTGRLYDNIDSFISLLTKDANFQYNQLDALLKYGDFIKWQKKSENKNKYTAIWAKTYSDKAGEFNGAEILNRANSEIIAVLKQHFEYGFKFNSDIELMRFRQFADTMGVKLPESDNALRIAICSSGNIIDGKVYFKDDDMLLELHKIIDDIFSSGVGVIYYESLFENKSEWMEKHRITSSDMLKEYLQKNVAGCSFSKKFMAKGDRRSEKDAVADELKRVWGTSPFVSIDDLHDRLPYIPPENIRRVISVNDLFVPVSEGRYFYIDYFVITEEEEEDILNYVEMTCVENGSASLSNVPLGGIEEENYELTQSVIYKAIYKKVLYGKYHLNNGKILTKEESGLDVITLLRRYINEKDECTFDEVADKVTELTGGNNRQYAFLALYDEMVRVDENRFVANRFVNFNVDEIDAVLSGFITDNFRAVRDVATFAMFPVCGQSWNHYVLESFCYKYSRKYSLHVIHFNDKNAGIIAEKEYNKTYDEMLAVAASRSNIELVPDVIGRYLFETGYMAKSKYAKLDEIAQQASELRKGR